MDECPILAIAISEFDIDKGNTLSSYWPQRFDWTKFEESNIADLCLPDGGHLHQEDWTYLFLHQKPSAPGSGGLPTASGSQVKSRTTALKKPEGPRTLSASTGGVPTVSGPNNAGSVSSLNTAAVAELGARTRADSLSPALSPRVMASPRKPLAAERRDTVGSDSGDSNEDGAGGVAGGPNGGSGSSSLNGPNHDLVYGLAMFHNKADKTVRRGAIQKSIVLLSKIPIFDVFQDILRTAVIHIIETGDKSALKTLFEAMKNQWGQKDLTVFNKTFPYTPSAPTLAGMKPDEFGSASLKELVQRFGVDTMYLWYTMLLRQRILFSGQPAHLVGECCLACPLLVAPLQGFARDISPYVALTDISPLERKHYICGTTNSIFETHTHRYDMMASFSTGIVRKSNAKLSAMDKEFILNVISGMSAKGEKWVRDQFFNYTKNFLDSVANNNYKSQQHRALGEPFRLSELYDNYVTQIKNAGPAGTSATSGSESLSSITTTLLQASQGKITLSDAKTKQLLWDLLQRLVDLNTIDELCEKNILAGLSPMLDSNSAQVRKYAVATLAQIAISIKGQISLIQHNLIPRVVLMLRDPMPNVASAAAYCLYKISSLFIGVTALVQHRVPKMLLNIICSGEDNLTLKISTAETLLQIHRLDPTLPIVGHDNIRVMIRSTSDTTFRNILLLLLDLWGEPRLPIKTNEEIEFHLSSLRAGGLDVRTGATSMVLSSVAQDRNLLLQIIAAGGVQVITKNLTQTAREEPLARLSMAILCLVCDTSMGRSSLIGYSAIPTVLAEFQATDFALHLYYVCRFCEVACQYPDTTEVFLQANGLDKLVETIVKYAEKPKLHTLAMPCLGALKYLALLNPLLLHKHQELVTIFMPVAETYQRMVRRSYDHLLATGNAATARSASSPFEAIIASFTNSPEDRDLYQLLNTVVSLWAPAELERMSKEVYQATGDRDRSKDVPIIDDELRVASEKLVTLLSSHHSQTRRSRSRRGTLGSPKSRGLDIISEDEESTSRRTSRATVDKSTDDDLMAAADSILADLDLSPAKQKSNPSFFVKGSPISSGGTTPHTKEESPETSSKTAKEEPSGVVSSSSASASNLSSSAAKPASVVSAIDAMDDGIDQLLADLAAESMRRSRSTTANEKDILAELEALGVSSPKSTTTTASSAPAAGDHSTSDSLGATASSTDSKLATGGSKIGLKIDVPATQTSVSGGGNNSGPGSGVQSGASSAHGTGSLPTSPLPGDTPRKFASALGGPLLGAAGAYGASKRPKFVPELNVGDMWDDIADLTTSILAEVPSAPSTPSTPGSLQDQSLLSGSALSGHTRTASGELENISSLSARAQRRSSLNFTSSGALLLDRELGSGIGILRPASGANSPAGGSPRSASSPAGESLLRSSTSALSPRKKNSPRLDTLAETDLAAPSGSASPRARSPSKRDLTRTHSRKTSGDKRAGSPLRARHSDASDDINTLASSILGLSSGSEVSASAESPGRTKRSNRRSIQITPSAALDDALAADSALSEDKTASERKVKRLSSELKFSSAEAPLESTSEEKKKLKRKSSTRNTREKEVEKSATTAASASVELKEPKKEKKEKDGKEKDKKDKEGKDKDKEKEKKKKALS